MLVRRASVGVIHAATLSLEQEFQVLEAAAEAGVKVPRPVAYLGELGGREAFAMERIEGETIGRGSRATHRRAWRGSSPTSSRRSTRSRPSACRS